MHIPFLARIIKSPFDEGLDEHNEKVKECVWAFQQAMECLVSDKCLSFDEHRQEVIKVRSEADAIKRRIRGHLPRLRFLTVNKYQLLMYLKEEDKILGAVEGVLEWFSGKADPSIPESLKGDIFLLVDAVIEPVEELNNMVAEAGNYCRNYSEKQRNMIKKQANGLRQKRTDAARVQNSLTRKALTLDAEPMTIFFMIKFIERIGSISIHAENAGDMMHAMLV